MVKKIFHVICFFVVLFCTSLPILLPTLLCGELIPIEEVIEKQHTAKEQLLYGAAYYDSNMYYKTVFAQKKSAPILALGTSRAMQIRGSFFKEPENFFNASGGVEQIATFINFLKNIEASKPNVLIISLDQNFFNYNWSDALPTHVGFPSVEQVKVDVLVNKLISDYTLRKVNIISTISNPEYIGVSAKIHRSGFLNDGSYFYGHVYKNPPITFTEIHSRIDQGTIRFQYGQEVSENSKIALTDLLQYCKENQIFVIGFTPPYEPSVNDGIDARGDDYLYMKELPTVAKGIFDSFGFEYYDYTNINSLGCDGSYFVDGFHGGDVAYLRMFKDMVRQGSILESLCDLEAMEKLDENRYSNLLLENPFIEDKYFTSN